MDFAQEWLQSVDAKLLEPKEKKAARSSLLKRFAYPKKCHLKKRHDFQKVSREGFKLFSHSFCLHYLDKSWGESRLGITVTKKFGKAHDRNFFKRSVREAFRHMRGRMPKKLDLNIRPLLQIGEIDKKTLQEELRKALSQLCTHEIPNKT